MFDMPLEKDWLGPTIYTWGKDQCDKIRSFYRDNLGDCKKTCEDWESCNAIIVKDFNQEIECELISCPVPIPAPDGDICGADNGCGGHYRATGTNANRHVEHSLIKKR